MDYNRIFLKSNHSKYKQSQSLTMYYKRELKRIKLFYDAQFQVLLFFVENCFDCSVHAIKFVNGQQLFNNKFLLEALMNDEKNSIACH